MGIYVALTVVSCPSTVVTMLEVTQDVNPVLAAPIGAEDNEEVGV